MTERKYMERAIALAKRGQGFTNPNPMVGAVIVKDDIIIGEGWHKKCGSLHAERDAFASLTEDAKGATIYVTLEPCCHHGKQPPCTEAIVAHGIKRVVIGSRDPNPLVSGKGVEFLREHGIEVIEDFMKDACDEINPVFFRYITTKRPYVVLKYAMSADGKIATVSGASKWITGPKAREEVQHMRHSYMAIMAGIGTVLADDPLLNVRIEGLKSPVRVIADSSLQIPLDCKLVQTAGKYRTIVACAQENPEKEEALRAAGVEILHTPGKDKRVDLSYLMRCLGEWGIDSVFVEGGGEIHYALLKEGLGDRAEVFVAPKLIGGALAKGPVGGAGFSELKDAVRLSAKEVKAIGEDLLITYDILHGKEDTTLCLPES